MIKKKNHTKIPRHILRQAGPTRHETIVIRTLGNFMFFGALAMLIKTFYAPLYQEVRYAYFTSKNTHFVVADTGTGKTSADYLSSAKNVEVLYPNDTNFGIVIPKIAANANVIANVDPSNEKEYLADLKKGVAHAKGTGLPGEGRGIYLFAHSTDYIWNVSAYNAVFYLLYKLEIGDEVDVFYQGVRHTYTVSDKKIIGSDEVSYVNDLPQDQEVLLLQTCWPPGTALKRLVVYAKPQ